MAYTEKSSDKIPVNKRIYLPKQANGIIRMASGRFYKIAKDGSHRRIKEQDSGIQPK